MKIEAFIECLESSSCSLVLTRWMDALDGAINMNWCDYDDVEISLIEDKAREKADEFKKRIYH